MWVLVVVLTLLVLAILAGFIRHLRD